MAALLTLDRPLCWRLACFSAASAICLGAFGAHSLKNSGLDPQRLKNWETAALYHLTHSLALLGTAVAPRFSSPAASCFIGGIVVFSGSLYMLTITGKRWWGALTPFGGVSFIAGWVLLGIKGV